MEISAAHRLSLSYESKCQCLHGHNWIITVYLFKKDKLNADGMVFDFTHIKKAIHDQLDHAYINDVIPYNPTAENIAQWVVNQFEECYKAEVQESEAICNALWTKSSALRKRSKRWIIRHLWPKCWKRSTSRN